MLAAFWHRQLLPRSRGPRWHHWYQQHKEHDSGLSDSTSQNRARRSSSSTTTSRPLSVRPAVCLLGSSSTIALSRDPGPLSIVLGATLAHTEFLAILTRYIHSGSHTTGTRIPSPGVSIHDNVLELEAGRHLKMTKAECGRGRLSHGSTSCFAAGLSEKNRWANVSTGNEVGGSWLGASAVGRRSRIRSCKLCTVSGC